MISSAARLAKVEEPIMVDHDDPLALVLHEVAVFRLGLAQSFFGASLLGVVGDQRQIA